MRTLCMMITAAGVFLGGCQASEEYSVPKMAPVQRLSQAGLYSDFRAKVVAEGNRTFRPSFELWSDGGVKTRWIRFPEAGQIDTTNPDRWVYPVGTTFFKEFVYLGKRVETRMLEKVDEGIGGEAWSVSVFLWRGDESEADRISHGMENVAATEYGTSHDVPSVEDCATCHASSGDLVLGFTGVQLAGAGDGLRLADLIREGKLTDPPEAEPRGPEDPVLARVAGMVHANCATCHSPYSNSDGSANGLHFHLPAAVAKGEKWPLEKSVGKLTRRFEVPGRRLGVDSLQVEAGNPEHSALYLMATKRGAGQMPPLATEVVDPRLDSAMKDWIRGL